MKKVFGWILAIWGGFNCLIHIICTPIVLTAEGQDWLQRLLATAIMVLFGVFWGFVCHWGFKLKKADKDNKATAPQFAAPEPTTQQPAATPVATPTVAPIGSKVEYLDDITFIDSVHHSGGGGNPWEQYDVMMDARGYGWDMMKDWADYMAEADLEGISQVTVAGAQTCDITDSYASHGGKCRETPELEVEQRLLSLAGFSKTLRAPVKIVWFNQTRLLRFFTTVRNENQMYRYAETVIRRSFGTEDAMKLGQARRRNANDAPAEFEENRVYVDSKALMKWMKEHVRTPQYELQGVLPLKEKEPVIELYEDGVKTRAYRLQTEGEEDFTGKYFFISIRMGLTGAPERPTAQIDGFISDTPEERAMTLGDVGYRMEGHFLKVGGNVAEERYKAMRGQDLVQKGLKYPGYTTPSNVRLVGVCPECGKSFCFHGYACYMTQYDVAYSDDGLDCCAIMPYNLDTDNWKYEEEGKTFRYYNSFCCPHCGTPYIDYKKHPENKAFGVSACVHLGRKLYECKE